MNSLIVEDDSTARFILSKWLEKFGPCETVANGEDGVDSFILSLDSGYPFDLISLDINMPGMDGLETLKRIRTIEKERGVPENKKCKVLMATSEEKSSSVMESFREQCNGYMTKPFHRKVLMEHLKKMGLIGITTPEPKESIHSLIIEDDRSTRFILDKWLNEKGSCESAEDGRSGLESFINGRESGQPFDLVLLDINLPEMNGIDVLKGIRDYESGLDLQSGIGTKIIMVTSEGKSKKVLEAFGENCDGYLTKPLEKKKMIDMLVKLSLVK